MKALSPATVALSLLAASLPLTSPVRAGTGIQRCQSADGTTIYTDKPCSALAAVSRPLPVELLNRIARAAAHSAPSPEYAGAAAPGGIAIARRSPTAGCARTPAQLSMDLRGSLALGDVNRLAESYHWVGLSHGQSKPIMQRLERLARQPLDDAQYFDARIGAGAMQLADTGNAATGVMQLRFGGASPQALDFEVARYAGCYFIKFEARKFEARKFEARRFEARRFEAAGSEARKLRELRVSATRKSLRPRSAEAAKS